MEGRTDGRRPRRCVSMALSPPGLVKNAACGQPSVLLAPFGAFCDPPFLTLNSGNSMTTGILRVFWRLRPRGLGVTGHILLRSGVVGTLRLLVIQVRRRRCPLNHVCNRTHYPPAVRVRAAFRAARFMPSGPLVATAFRAARLRSDALRLFALLSACRESSSCDTAWVPSR